MPICPEVQIQNNIILYTYIVLCKPSKNPEELFPVKIKTNKKPSSKPETHIIQIKSLHMEKMMMYSKMAPGWRIRFSNF